MKICGGACAADHAVAILSLETGAICHGSQDPSRCRPVKREGSLQN